jgi:hypothetical protein
MNSKKLTRKPISSKKNQGPQGMFHDASTPPVRETASTPAPFSYQELREINIQISASWFRAPEVTHLTLMEVHPWRLHAYWNIAAADMAAARGRLPTDAAEPSLILRFTDLSAQRGKNIANHRFDIEVQGLTNSWYVDLWQDGRRYSAQLGLRTQDGDMISLASSNEVVLPLASPSSELDFKQLEVRSPLPLDLPQDRYAPATVSDSGDHLLQNLFPGGPPLDERFPEFESNVSDTKQFEEPECPALMRAIDALADCPEPFKPELELIDYVHAFRPLTLTQDTEFPQIKNSEINPYGIQAKKEKDRLLSKIKIELPPMAEETVSPADMDHTSQPFPLFKSEPELPHNTLLSEPLSSKPLSSKPQLSEPQPDEPALESSTPPGGLDTAEAQGPGARSDVLHEGFPEVMSESNPDFSEHESPVPIAETGVGQAGLAPFELQDDEIVEANTSQAHHPMADTAVVAQPGAVSGSAPRPVIALEEVLGNALFSYGRGKSGIEVTAELHLHGTLESDSVLSLLGEQVHVDAQGNFSVRLKLDRGPALSTLLYGQRKRPEDHR